MVLDLGFCVRARDRVSITGSVSYLNVKFVVFLAFVVPFTSARASSNLILYLLGTSTVYPL